MTSFMAHKWLLKIPSSLLKALPILLALWRGSTFTHCKNLSWMLSGLNFLSCRNKAIFSIFSTHFVTTELFKRKRLIWWPSFNQKLLLRNTFQSVFLIFKVKNTLRASVLWGHPLHKYIYTYIYVYSIVWQCVPRDT